MDIDFPCKCGHAKEQHYAGKYACMVVSPREPNYYCNNCPTGYTPDNLKYLEQKYD